MAHKVSGGRSHHVQGNGGPKPKKPQVQEDSTGQGQDIVSILKNLGLGKLDLNQQDSSGTLGIG